jgi:hypothetical protein
VFSASFSKFLFGGFGEFQRVTRQKIWRGPFSVFSKFLSAAAGAIFAQEPTLAGRQGNGGVDFDFKQLEYSVSWLLKKQNDFCDFCCRH